ncbi:hypothetical protein [Pedobacter chitinilyticus]|uniref:hypothetical protein n=1 Tax=Pedobacter chitinilyticus TaxID=2233776 RepID=UPI001969911F|nr:hypothetical protein [Pedobacter chitinilyticus]
MKFILILFLAFLGFIYAGNYIDYRQGNISRREFERRVRISIVLILIVIFIYFYYR